jgi:hypothetical protein
MRTLARISEDDSTSQRPRVGRVDQPQRQGFRGLPGLI